jgi:hypothetical protein
MMSLFSRIGPAAAILSPARKLPHRRLLQSLSPWHDSRHPQSRPGAIPLPGLSDQHSRIHLMAGRSRSSFRLTGDRAIDGNLTVLASEVDRGENRRYLRNEVSGKARANTGLVGSASNRMVSGREER